jgi:hypothetical protein
MSIARIPSTPGTAEDRCRPRSAPFMPVVDGEIEIAFPDEKVSNTAQRLGAVSLAKLGQEDSDCLHTLSRESTGDHAWSVVEFGCSGLTRSRVAVGMEGRTNRSGRRRWWTGLN